MGRKPKLRDALKRVQKLQSKRQLEKKSDIKVDKPKMAVRHRWSNGLETIYPIIHPSDDEDDECTQSDMILVVGDGDFSYSCALLRQFGESFAKRLISTVYDGQSLMQEKYSQAAGNVMLLKDAGVRVMFEVDARKLDQIFANQQITRIIFNYPHTGAGIKDRDRNIRAQQEMLLSFFQSCRRLFMTHSSANSISRRAIVKQSHHSLKQIDDDSEDEVDFELSMQPEIHVTIRTGDPYDDWQIKRVAEDAGLKLLESFAFDPRIYPGYHHCRTIGDQSAAEEDFLGKPAKTFVFILQIDK